MLRQCIGVDRLPNGDAAAMASGLNFYPARCPQDFHKALCADRVSCVDFLQSGGPFRFAI